MIRNSDRRPMRIALPALMMLAGCAGSSRPQPEPPALPASWQSAAQAQSTPLRAAADLKWQDFITDPRLRDLIERGLSHNSDMVQAYARIEEARAALGIAEAERWPNVNLSTQFQAQRAPTSVTGTTMSDIRRYDLNLVMPAFEVDLWGRLAALSDASRARLLATREAARIVRMGLIVDIANAYFSVLELEERERLIQDVLRTRESVVELTQQAVSLGAAAAMEQLQAQSQLDAARTEFEGLRRQRMTTQNLLDLLTGYGDAPLPVGRSLAGQSLDAAFATGLPSDVLLQRPDVRAAELRLAEAEANVEAARAMYFPRILLAAGVGVASAALGNLLSQGQLASSIVPSLALPLFDGGRTAASVELNAARVKLAVADYQKTVRTSFREVADLLAAQETFRKQTGLAVAEMMSQLKREEVVEARFRAGAASQIEVLEARRQRLNAEAALVQYRRVELSVAMQLYKALGGGADLP